MRAGTLGLVHSPGAPGSRQQRLRRRAKAQRRREAHARGTRSAPLRSACRRRSISCTCACPCVLDVAGASVPGLPRSSVPHARAAWGVRQLNADVSDVYADSLSADGKSRMRWRGGRYTLRDEPYAMRFRLPGGTHIPAFGQHRRYGPHGPVVSCGSQAITSRSELRWGPPDSLVTLRAFCSARGARPTRARVARRFSTLTVPCLNMVAADVQGRVVYHGRRCGAATRGRSRSSVHSPATAARSGSAGPQAIRCRDGSRRPMDSSSAAANLPRRSRLRWPAWLRLDFPHDRALRIAGAARRRSAHHARRSAQRPERRPLARGPNAFSRGCSPRPRGRVAPEPARAAARDTLSAWDL